MSIQHLESEIHLLSAQLTRQEQQIVELQKQLTDMQAAMSCGDKLIRDLNYDTLPLDGVFGGVVSI